MGLLDRIRTVANGAARPQAVPAAGVTDLIAEGNALEDQGRPREALQCYDTVIAREPDLARAHLNRGNALLSLNDVSGATDAYERAVTLEPDLAGAHFNLGNALMRSGRFEIAMSAYRRALELRPDFRDAEVALGVAQHDAGQLDEAEASYRRVLAIEPGYAEVHSNLGHILASLGRLEEAEASYRRALEIKPAYVKAVRGLGDVLNMQGRVEDAAATLREALAVDPGAATVHNDLGNVLQQLGMFDEALASYARAIEIDPRYVEAHSNAGCVHLRCGRIREAIECQRRAIAIKPGFAEAHFNLANALREGGRPGEAIASYRRALAIKPESAIGYVGLGGVQNDTGSLREAQASLRHALEIDPEMQEAHTSLLFCMSHDESVTPEVLYEEHRRFGDRFEAPRRADWPVHPNARDPERRLRIGFVSGDLRAHPVAYFIEPLLPYLTGAKGLSLHAYSNHAEDDAVSHRLRRHFHDWKSVALLSDDRLAALVSRDAIDVLIDLSGHTARNRLLTFARKPAPIQASWMGYPGTTGLEAMDYYFADEQFLPLAEFASQFTEKLVHLPASVAFLPEPVAPPVASLPALANGHLTFGSFNRLSKMSPSVIALWSRILRALPDARLVLGAMPQDGRYGQLVDRFLAEGIAQERLTFHVRSDIARYLSLHNRVDVCLDTFPYAGGTTTAHALWMGVPTLTLAGSTPAGRQGAAILGQAGLGDYVAHDADDYVRKAVDLATDRQGLAAIRATLRARCEAAPNRRPEVVAAAVERALRTMWKRWCAGQKPEAFAVSLDKFGH